MGRKGVFLKNTRSIWALLFFGSLALSLTGCGSPQLVAIYVTPANMTVPVGATQQLTASGLYSDEGRSDITSQVTWSSSNTSVATVNSSGLVTTVSAGNSTITASQATQYVNSGSVSTSIVISATPALTSLAITPANPNLPAGITRQFIATGTYSDGTFHDITSQVIWTSSNTSVATVNTTGLVTTVSVGTGTLTAVQGSISASTTLTVTTATLSSIAITPANPNLPAGVTQQFTATGTYSDGTSLDLTTQVAWSTADPSVATVTTTGLVTTVAAGTSTLTAAQGGISGSTNLTVTAATLSSITVTPADPNIPIGFIQQFTATGTYSDGTSFNISKLVTWGWSNGAVVTMDGTGLATAIGAGASIIAATRGSISASTTLTVNFGGLSSITVTPANLSIPAGVTLQFTATGIFPEGTANDKTSQVAWTSSNPAVATVSASGLVTAISPGTTTITSTSGTITGSTTLTVTPG